MVIGIRYIAYCVDAGLGNKARDGERGYSGASGTSKTNHVQVVAPVMLVKPTDTSPLASTNISPLTKIPTSLST